VIAVARRFAALTNLAKEKAIPKTFGVPCRVVDGEAGTETSLAENVVRNPMHPADQFIGFRTLVDEGMGVEEVAARFGVTAPSQTITSPRSGCGIPLRSGSGNPRL
jgi:ParB family chromosome partitioning protein